MQLARGSGGSLDHAIATRIYVGAMKPLGAVGDEDKATGTHQANEGGDC